MRRAFHKSVINLTHNDVALMIATYLLQQGKSWRDVFWS
ncbi:hypothetical protein ECP02999174_0460 [Escherichia coli P0299917.4]|nr:hypothetical protein ECDEC12C_0479 [Escherichia coli DEC12C]ENC59607.1 hypothetical protein ECP02999174_0460 [Escherichia coli P0299917.4]